MKRILWLLFVLQISKLFSVIINNTEEVSFWQKNYITSNYYSTIKPTLTGAAKSQSLTSANLKGNGMCFVPNKGQVADTKGNLRPDVLYTSKSGGANVYLRKTGLSYVLTNMRSLMHEVDEEVEAAEEAGKIDEDGEEELRQSLLKKTTVKGYRIDIDFLNCNPQVQTLNQDNVPGLVNFYYPHCKDGVTGLNQYNTIVYQNIYNKVDVVYYGGKAQGLKYDIVVQPGGNPSDIKLKYSGADKVSLVNNKLVVKTAVGDLAEWMPKVYQQINGKEILVQAGYSLTNFGSAGEAKVVSFKLGTYNSEYPLIIDPWISYYGGSDVDWGFSVTNDALGNVIFSGRTLSIDFPLSVGPYQVSNGGLNDAFVVSMPSSGASVIFATYIGGTSDDIGYGITTDSFNNIFFCGSTTSSDFPIASFGANTIHQAVFGASGSDGFIVKLNSAGALQFSSFYNGICYDVVVSNLNEIVVCGSTNSGIGISTVGAFQTVFAGAGDSFLVKFSNLGVQQWGTYFGGSNIDYACGLAIDISTNDIYFTGTTRSLDFPVTLGCHQAILGGSFDAILVKLASNGARVWASYYGGAGKDFGYAICIGATGNPIFGGVTSSTVFGVIATAGVFQTASGGLADGFISNFNVMGVRQWGTYLGGANVDYVTGIACDASYNIVVGGDTYSTNFPTTACAYQPAFAGSEDQFIFTFDPAGASICSSYIGIGLAASPNNETGQEFGGSISVFGPNAYLVASSQCNYPVTAGAYQTVCGGNYDACISQLDIGACGIPPPLSVSTASAPDNCSCSGAITLTLTSGCKLPPYNYYLSNGMTTLNSSSLATTFNALCTNVYNYTVTTSSTAAYGTVAITGCTLPVDLIDFNAVKENKMAKLFWTTSSEHTTSHYELEKSEDGVNWNFFSKVKAAGNSNTKNNYVSYDKNLSENAITYYKLKQFDVGNSQPVFTEVVALSINNNVDQIKVYPNPAKDNIYIKFPETSNSYNIKFFDSYGRLVFETSNSNQSEMTLNIQKYVSGCYYLQVSNGILLKNVKVLKMDQ